MPRKKARTVLADAHCDIPCGLYDPHNAQLAAKTVETMVRKIRELDPERGGANVKTFETENAIVRLVKVKEEHAQLCKTELLILWTDYFKPNHLELFPDLHEAFWTAAKLCSYNKQHVDAGKAAELREAVDQIAAMFAKAEAEKAEAEKQKGAGNGHGKHAARGRR